MPAYIEIFEEIVDIAHHDYAGWEDKQDWDRPAFYLGELERLQNKKQLTPQKFTDIVNEYLSDFQDRHMYFLFEGTGNVNVSTRGFQTRRYKNALYVTETNEEERFPKGTKIISIDHQPIEQARAASQYLLNEASAEREDWSALLKKSSFIKVEDADGKITEFALKDYEPARRKKVCSLKAVSEKTMLLTLPSFADADTILAFIQNHKNELSNCINLIIDVRNNSGGNGQAISALLPYIFPPGERPGSEVKGREFNCTNRNSDLFIQLCRNARENIEDEGTRNVLDFAEEQFETHRGQGFVTFDFSNLMEEEVSEFEGTALPERVVVMTDSNCASAAEYFVETCMESSKVTVVGRSTMGVNDYSDLVIKHWDNMFSLYYPVSRIALKTPNDPVHGKGIQPHHYVPWTPQHLREDVDLYCALEMFQTKCAPLE